MTISDLVQWFSERGAALCSDAALLYLPERAPRDRTMSAAGNIYGVETALNSIKTNGHYNLMSCGWAVNRSDGKIDVNAINGALDEHRRRVTELAMEALLLLWTVDNVNPERVSLPPEGEPDRREP